MAHWPVPRLRGLHPSMTKFDGALRSEGLNRSRGNCFGDVVWLFEALQVLPS